MEVCTTEVEIGKDDSKSSLCQQNPEVSSYKAFSDSAFTSTNGPDLFRRA
jgi:hypothetical protein